MKKKLIKILSIVLVLNIFMVPFSTFAPGNQIKTVHASGELVDIRFFNAMVTMIGVTAVGITGMMSQSFSIPEVDMVALKDQFQTTLDADATKKTAWMNAQSDYLAGGVAKTMGAVELAKIGFNDVYIQFLNYIKNKLPNVDIKNSITEDIFVDGYKFNVKRIPDTPYQFLYPVSIAWENYGIYQTGYNQLRSVYRSSYENITPNGSVDFINSYMYNPAGSLIASITLSRNGLCMYAEINKYYDSSNLDDNKYFIQYLNQFGINAEQAFSLSSIGISGSISYIDNNIINSDTDSISVIPTIPWIPDVPIGTVVTPAIAAPYVGVVPIDVPITVPIDPPIDEPVDPPAEPTLIGTVAAILAGLTPIAGFLEHILAGQVSLTDAIEAGLTDVVDGIGDIAGTLTGGITSSLTDIQSSISTLTAPATDTVNLDPVKNIPKVLFTKFPFSIPWDLFNVYNLMATDNRSPPEFSLGIPMTKSTTLSAFGVGDINMSVKLENYDQIFGIIRVGELLLFVIGLIFATKKLIWG